MGKVLSFDQSTKKTGHSVFIDGQYVSSGVINLDATKEDKKLSTAERFNKMYESILEVIKKEKPDVIVFEDVQSQGNMYTFQLLSQLQGTIIGACYMLNIPFRIYKPSEWRMALGYHQGPKVKRPELKQQSIDYVKEHYGIEVDEDQSEAIAINAAYHVLNDADDYWGE